MLNGVSIDDYKIKFPTGSKLKSVVIRETKFRITWPTRNHFGQLWRAFSQYKERKSLPVQSTKTDEGETITGKSTIVKTFNIFSWKLCPNSFNQFNQLSFFVSLMKSLLMKVLCFNPFPKTLFLSNWRT